MVQVSSLGLRWAQHKNVSLSLKPCYVYHIRRWVHGTEVAFTRTAPEPVWTLCHAYCAPCKRISRTRTWNSSRKYTKVPEVIQTVIIIYLIFSSFYKIWNLLVIILFLYAEGRRPCVIQRTTAKCWLRLKFYSFQPVILPGFARSSQLGNAKLNIEHTPP